MDADLLTKRYKTHNFFLLVITLPHLSRVSDKNFVLIVQYFNYNGIVSTAIVFFIGFYLNFKKL